MSTKLFARRLSVLVGALILLTGALAGPAMAASELPGTFRGAAWGNHANAKAGAIATHLGRAAYLPCPCPGTDGKVITTTQNDVDSGDAYSADKIVSTAQADKTASRAFGRTSSRVIKISALGGRITADAVHAFANLDASSTVIRVSDAGSSITGLRINGRPERASRGRQINLPGFGYVVFHNVDRYGDGVNLLGVRVEMMRIVITRENNLDIPVGSVIRVGHAELGYWRKATRAVVSASAWAADATSSSPQVENAIGRVAPAYLVCLTKGTNAGSNRANSTSAPETLNMGLALSEVYGSVTSDLALARAASRLESVNFLDGLLTADVIRGVAQATLDDNGGHTSFAGSKFVNLRVLGQKIGDNVAPNTKVTVPGIGTLTLFATTSRLDGDEASATVRMVVLNVTVPNTRRLPVGTQIRLVQAAANAGM